MDHEREVPALRISPIGVIRSPWKEAAGTPVQPVFAGGATGSIEIAAEYEEALTDIEGFERLWLLYWFDRVGAFRPLVTPYLDRSRHGVLATRAPVRPVPIGISSVRLLARRGCTLDVADIDVLDGTPLIDIKPYVPRFDAYQARAGWFDAASAENTRDDGRFGANAPRDE